MAAENGPDDAKEAKPGKGAPSNGRDGDLERRRQELDASLAARSQQTRERESRANSGPTTGYGQAFKLSSEFIAGIAVGAAIGWAIDRLAGTSPWGLVVFLLLGFVAGVLNVLRSVGKVAEFGQNGSKPGRRD